MVLNFIFPHRGTAIFGLFPDVAALVLYGGEGCTNMFKRFRQEAPTRQMPLMNERLFMIYKCNSFHPDLPDTSYSRRNLCIFAVEIRQFFVIRRGWTIGNCLRTCTSLCSTGA